MKILVTGGSGMVGKNLIPILKRNKFKIFSPTRKEMDLNNYQNIKFYILKKKPNLIIHLASIVGGIQANINNPIAFLEENLIINTNIIKAANNCNIKYFLNISSSCMYPKNIKKKLKESMLLSGKLEPTNEGYAISKIAAMKMCEYISLKKNKLYKTLIPCNLYGEHDNFYEISSHLISAIIKKIHFAKLNKIKTVEIWGNGKAKREFLFAADFADFILYAIKNYSKIPHIMNVGTGRDYTILDYYKIVAKILNYNGKFKFDKKKPTGMKKKLLDISKQKKLRWKPKTKIKDGISKTYNFFIKKYS